MGCEHTDARDLGVSVCVCVYIYIYIYRGNFNTRIYRNVVPLQGWESSYIREQP